MKLRQSGLSLVELMISTTIGLFLLGGLFAVYLESQNTRRTAETVARMQEQGRYAMISLANEIQHAGYWGQTTYEGTMVGQNSNAPLNVTVINDCATSPSWALELSSEIEAFNDTNPYSETCLANSEYVPNTDILVIRSTGPDVTNTANPDAIVGEAGQLYIRSDVTHGQLFAGGTTPPASTGFLDPQDHRYTVSLYYVRPWAYEASDNQPVLRRLILTDGGSDPAVQNHSGETAYGAEDFQIQLGLTSNAGTRFVNPDDPAVADDMSNVVALRLWLLLRAETGEQGYVNNTTYKLADRSVTFNDNIRRMLFTQTVQLRNMID